MTTWQYCRLWGKFHWDGHIVSQWILYEETGEKAIDLVRNFEPDYEAIHIYSNSEDAERAQYIAACRSALFVMLHKLGQEGWELVTANTQGNQFNNQENFSFWFKRQTKGGENELD